MRSEVLLAAITLPALANLASAHETPSYSHEGTTGETNTDWMGDLPDTIKLSVLDTMQSFLASHSDEAIIMRVKHEGDRPGGAEFASIVNSNLTARGNLIYNEASDNPTLAQMRGKIVVLTQYDPAWSPGGIRWFSLDIQDAYIMETNWDLAKKWDGHGTYENDHGNDYPKGDNNVVDQFQRANPKDHSDDNKIYVNFLSAATGGFPYFFASGHRLHGTDSERLWTGFKDGDINTCGGFDVCLPARYYPRVDCYGCEDCGDVKTRTCFVAFEGLNHLAKRYINNAEERWMWRTGIVFAEYPGKGLISTIIAVNKRRANHGAQDVGVIPTQPGGCGKPEDAVTIHLDNEDDNNGNNAGGWHGGVTQDSSGTTFRVCRVDGSAFRPLSIALAPSGQNGLNLNYAVLKLGTSCPPDSVEFWRSFDTEDEDNGSHIEGDAWPNRLTPDDHTELHFCLFQPSGGGVQELPTFDDLPHGYGVFAALNFLGEDLDQENRGFVYIDDEDYNNQNGHYVPPTPGVGNAASQVVYFGDNTTINFAKPVSGGGECFGAPPGSQCEDGNRCTTGDTCFSGRDGSFCSGSVVVCENPGDQCHLAAVCDPNTGGCINPPVPDGGPNKGDAVPCDDGDPCTIREECKAGACVGIPKCPAPDSCHFDATCGPTGACNAAPPVPDGTLCDDGSACTRGDQCIAGVCTGTTADLSPCDDGNPCTTGDFCDGTRCIFSGTVTNGTACTDNNVCTLTSACSNGLCEGTSSNNNADCSDGNPCNTGDRCEGFFCVGSGGFVPDGTPCDDGDVCTIDDSCDQTCQAGTYVCAALATPVPSATPSASPLPSATPTPNPCSGVPPGTSCDDGDLCTANDECFAGVCSGVAVVCTAQDQCHVAGTCAPGSGVCSNPAAPDTTACDDGDPCTANDQCTGGNCAGTGTCPTATVPAGTPTATSNVATPTATSNVAAPTATPNAAATASRTPCPGDPVGPTCAGDCNGNATVAVNELVIGVNIALGRASVCACPPFNRDSDDTVSIAELITGVNSALRGCPP